jgi:hypothetical protein
MTDQNVIISQDVVTVTGGATTLAVDANFGRKGDNGSVILYGHGKPQNIKEFPKDPQLLDWYINIDSTDDEYLYIYQYIYTNNVGNWTRVFKITPNSYQVNKVVNFNAQGIGTALVEVANTTLPLLPQVQFPSSGSIILPAADEEEMLALSSATPGVYCYRADLAKYYYLKASPSTIASNWEGLATINSHINIENPFPVIMSFQNNVPDIITDSNGTITAYVLQINLVAYELGLSGPVPIVGDRTVHININVI